MDRGKTLIATLMFAGCLISGIAAVASKENAGMLPIFILLYEWFFFQDLKSPWSSKKLLLITFAAILFSMIAITYLGENPINRILQGYANRDFTMFQRVITEWRVVVYYISLFFFPSPARLSLEHDYPLSMSPADPLTTFFSLTAIIGLIGVALYKAQKDRLVLFCILWFMGNLIIESSVIGIEIIFEHRTYLPFMMVALLAAALVERVILPKKKAVVLLFGLSLLFAVWTHQRNALWADTIVFLDDCVQKAPDKIRPRFNLATELQLKGNSSDSIYHLEQVLKKDPLYIKAYNNIGNIWISLDNIDKALDYYFMALSLDPAKIKQKNQNLSSIHLNLGSILLHRKMADEAAYHFQAGLNLNPHNAQANYLMGVTLMQTGEYDQAENYFKKALLLDPELDQAQRSILQIALLKKTPIKHGKKIIEIYPENIPLHFRLGGFYQKQNDPEHAVAQYRKILELEPHHDGALKGMKDCNG
jgi:tetratricopeptide (TPR) repeat protein